MLRRREMTPSSLATHWYSFSTIYTLKVGFYRFCGLDGIFPIVLQQGQDSIYDLPALPFDFLIVKIPLQLGHLKWCNLPSSDLSNFLPDREKNSDFFVIRENVSTMAKIVKMPYSASIRCSICLSNMKSNNWSNCFSYMISHNVRKTTTHVNRISTTKGILLLTDVIFSASLSCQLNFYLF